MSQPDQDSVPDRQCDRCATPIALEWVPDVRPLTGEDEGRFEPVDREVIWSIRSDGQIAHLLCPDCFATDISERYAGARGVVEAMVEIDTMRRAEGEEEAAQIVADDELLWQQLVDRRRELLGHQPTAGRQRRRRSDRLPRSVRAVSTVPAIVAHVEPHKNGKVRCGIYMHDAQRPADPQPPVCLHADYLWTSERMIFRRTSLLERLTDGGHRTRNRDPRVDVDQAAETIGELRARADELQALVLAEALDRVAALRVSQTWLLAAGVVDRTPTLIAGAEADAHVAARGDARAEAVRVAAELQPAAGRGRRGRDRRAPHADDLHDRQILPPANDPLESP